MDIITFMHDLLFGRDHVNSHGWLAKPPAAAKTYSGETAGDRYVRFRLTDMRLAVGRRILADQEPVLQSIVSVKIGGAEVKVPKTVGPDAFATLAPGTEFRRLSVDGIYLTDWLPYNTGTVELLVGLLSVPKTDGLVQAAGVMNDLSELVMVPAISTVTDIASKLANGVQILFGTDRTRGLLAAQVQVADDEVISRYYLSVGNDMDANDVAHYSYDESTKTLLHSDEPVDETDFFVVEMQVRQAIAKGWQDIPSIAGPFGEATTALAEQPDKADSLAKVAWLAAVQCPDLTREDRKRVSKAVLKEWKALKKSEPITAALLDSIDEIVMDTSEAIDLSPSRSLLGPVALTRENLLLSEL